MTIKRFHTTDNIQNRCDQAPLAATWTARIFLLLLLYLHKNDPGWHAIIIKSTLLLEEDMVFPCKMWCEKLCVKLTIKVSFNWFYVISFVRYNSLSTKDIIPAQCIIQHGKRILVPNMVMPQKRNETEIWNVITGITHSQIFLNLIVVLLIYDWVLTSQEMDVSFSKLGLADTKCVVILWQCVWKETFAMGEMHWFWFGKFKITQIYHKQGIDKKKKFQTVATNG